MFRAHFDVLSDAGTSLKPERHSGLTVVEGLLSMGPTLSSFLTSTNTDIFELTKRANRNTNTNTNTNTNIWTGILQIQIQIGIFVRH